MAVRLRPGFPTEHFDASDLSLDDGEWVVVETAHGDEVGQTVGRVLSLSLPSELPRVRRIASTEEIKSYGANLERERRAREICQELIEAHGLEMKLIRVESFFDGSKIVFYYSAEGRVDFRALVRDLVRALHTRIEMRQIGIRHEAKMVGGIGSCGRAICCAGFMKSFAPVSIKMAKAQNLPLNPNKISGLCGRLLCCITYEYESYADGTMAAWAQEAKEAEERERLEPAPTAAGAVFPELGQTGPDAGPPQPQQEAGKGGGEQRAQGGRKRRRRRPGRRRRSKKGAAKANGQSGGDQGQQSKRGRKKGRKREEKRDGDGE